MDVLEVLRLFFGGIFILFVPGFAWSYVFFARKNIDWIERVALSFGLSIALVPLTVFWFNFLFQVKVTLLNTCLVVCGLIAVPVLYILITRSAWGKNATSRVKSALRLGRGSKGS
jgi:uncharacterized membrane protein